MKVVLILFLYSISGFAGEVENFMQQLSDSLEKLSAPQKHRCPARAPPTPEFIFPLNDDTFQCIKDICGEFTSYNNTSFFWESKREEIAAIARAKKPEVRKLVSEFMREEVATMEMINTSISQGNWKLPLDRELWPRANLMLLLSQHYLKTDAIGTPITTFNLTEKLMFNNFLSSLDRLPVHQNFNHTVGKPDLFVMKQFPGSSLQESMMLTRNSLAGKIEAILNNRAFSQKLRDHFSRDPLISEFLEATRRNPEFMPPLGDLASLYHYVEVNSEVLNKPDSYSQFYRSPGDLNRIYGDWQARRTGAQVEQRRWSDPQIVNEVTDLCAHRLARGLVVTPQESQREDIVRDFTEAKRQVESGFLSRLSNTSRRILKTQMDLLNVTNQPTKAEFEILFFQDIQSKIGLSKRMKAGLRSLPRATYNQYMKSYLYDAYSTAETEDVGIVDQICWEAADGEGYAAYAGVSGIGIDSLQIPEYRKAGLRHEIMHSLFPREGVPPPYSQLSEHSSKTVNEVKTCLNSQHTEVQGETHWYESEDLADVGAALAGPGELNPSCKYFEPLGEEVFRAVVSGSGESYFDREDVHSPDLFRMLRYQFIKYGGFSPACQKVLASPKAPKFKRC